MASFAAAAAQSAPLPDARRQLESHLRGDIAEMRQRMAAVIAATHDAATMIIDTVESTFEALGPSLAPELQEKMFNILSACAFQDIAGQHLARMTELLNDIQQGTADTAPDETLAGEKLHHRNMTLAARSSRMAGGPALAGEGLHQPEVDWLISNAANRSE